MQNSRKQGKTATYKKAPQQCGAKSLTNKIFNMAKLLQKLFSRKRNEKKVQDQQLQVINGYLCYKKRRYSELNYEQKEQYNDCFIPQADKEAFLQLLKRTQLRYV